jgi:hypothetical protein
MAQKSEQIREEIEHTREDMGETVDALAYKADVPARTKQWLGDKKDAVTSAVGGAASRTGEAAPDMGDVKHGAGRMKRVAEDNPLGLAIGGAAIGFLAGLFAPSTRMEDEKVGPMADEVKATAAEAGREAVERGKRVAQEAGHTAIDTAKEVGQQESEELSASLEQKAREASSKAEAS